MKFHDGLNLAHAYQLLPLWAGKEGKMDYSHESPLEGSVSFTVFLPYLSQEGVVVLLSPLPKRDNKCYDLTRGSTLVAH